MTDHARFKNNYSCTHYHGDTSWGGVYGDTPTGTVSVDRYEPDVRTELPNGDYMVIWVCLDSGTRRVPAFKNGYTREDALALAGLK